MLTGGVKPIIDDVMTVANQMIVSWSSNNSGIVKAIVSLETEDVSVPSFCLDLTKKEAVFNVVDVDLTVAYNITVIEYNKCEQNFSVQHIVSGSPSSAVIPMVLVLLLLLVQL